MFKFVKNLVKRSPKKTAVIVGVAAAVLIPASVALANWGPDRPTFDWNKFDPNKSCVDPSQANGRCGSMDGPVFDSFVNNPAYGDERNFNRVANASGNASNNPLEGSYVETANAVPGQEYWVRTYVHNDANQNLNGANNDGISVAHNTRVKVDIAKGTANGIDVLSTISADNAKPGAVWDAATLSNNSQAFSVSYVPGSAVLYNGPHQTGTPLSDAIVSANGTPIGFNQMDGTLPGCFDFSAFVYVKVKVNAPTLTVTKQSKVDGTDTFATNTTAKKNDKIDWRIKYANTGSDVANDVTIRDQLPAGVTLVPGSIKWTDINRTNQVLQDTALDQGGIDLGNYAPAGAGNISGFLTFQTTINKDFNDCSLHNVAFGRAKDVPETSGDSTVTISDCQPVTPVFSCDLLKAESLGDRNFRFTLSVTAMGGATFKNASYNFGDGSQPLLTDKMTVDHQYSQDGTFTAKATVTFTVNGVDKTVTSDACATPVSSTTPPNMCTLPGKENLPANSPECVVTPTPSTPTTLVNTGPGDVAGIFAATTIAGAVAYRVFMARRLGRQ